MKKIIENNKNIIVFMICIMVIGFIIGIFYYYLLNSDIKNNILLFLDNYNNFKYNGILKDVLILSFLLITSFFIVGIPFSIIYLLFDSFTLGFLFIIFKVTFGFSGIIYMLFYLIINKLLFYILYIIFFKRIYSISIKEIECIFKNKNILNDKVMYNFKSCLYLILFIFIIDLILYFISGYIFSYLFKVIV